MIRLIAKNVIFSLSIFMQTACEAGMVSKKEDIVLFSRIEGQLFYQGKPLPFAKVIRRYIYDTEKPVEDYCIADANGFFKFPSVIRENQKISPLTQFVSHQEVVVEYMHETYTIWGHGKMHVSENSEYDGVFKKMKCHIDGELHRVRLSNRDFILTNCIFED
ncbi:MAG TPA: hypothetical protein PK129_10590 [Cellvibrionaceae bacterium]|nr:hypothetical protein [Cellvibrionaceae bacterium]